MLHVCLSLQSDSCGNVYVYLFTFRNVAMCSLITTKEKKKQRDMMKEIYGDGDA